MTLTGMTVDWRPLSSFAPFLGPSPLFGPEALYADEERPPPGEQDDEPARLACWFFPELREWWPVLARLHVTVDQLVGVASLARRNGTRFEAELLASGLVSEAELSHALCEELDLSFVDTLDAERLVLRDAQALTLLSHQGNRIVRLGGSGGSPAGFAVSPAGTGPDTLRTLFARYRTAGERVALAPAEAMRSALLERARPVLVHRAVNGLFERLPSMSARIVANAWQGAVVGALLVGLPVALALQPAATFAGMHYFFSLFFLACVALRLAALTAALPARRERIEPFLPKDMPTYTVLVALYREAEIAGDLMRSLRRLVWPASKLEVKLVCEADDMETIAALQSAGLPFNFEIIAVPPDGPRTKPKALAYALPLARGELVALYDAEDAPDPFQLVQAWRRFAAAGPELACVQAPLEIVNGDCSLIARMFEFEYAALFRGLLPWLSRHRLPLPLGGTSNHFRRSVLEQVGGWDPYNVTEDADLGLRLVRFGYRTGTISRPTFEAAPVDFATWLPQRTRWFKGWLQTWLVHMRNPLRLLRELGPASFLAMQVLFAGMIVSALAHPMLLVTALALAADAAVTGSLDAWRSTLLAFDLVNIACGYIAFLLLGRQALDRSERRDFWKVVAFTPFYWMMLSAAAWRAIYQLWRDPYRWEKTPHRPLDPSTQAGWIRPAGNAGKPASFVISPASS